MPSELEDLVGFINHGSTPVRQLAVENLVPYSLSQPAIFKTNGLLPVKHLKLLVRDYPQIAKNALDILINLSDDHEILEDLAKDNTLLDSLLSRLTSPTEPNANLIAMLLANLGKEDNIKILLQLGCVSPEGLKSSDRIIDQLFDLFVKGADGTYNKDANYDYLAYLFADIAKHSEGRKYFLTKQEYDGVIPLTKLTVFTEHKSDVRRKGVASTIKNVAFETDKHGMFLAEDDINILPYLLLPIIGGEEYSDEDQDGMLDDLQLLPPYKARDSDPEIIKAHVETLMLLTNSRQGRDTMRRIKVYPVIRETHLAVEDEGVREACERLVQVLMRDEEGQEVSDGMKQLERTSKRPAPAAKMGGWADQESEDDDDDEIKEV
ncbi:hypothetical protein V495_04328 [Pseudogymnoascus sp. VKM F-4514 (FW-929)]|nr:hypothetical protein V495_04328 [Pseudogymnoascus sp. VKM F-4514 (FW-929)]KFY59484.1 hypothetical protein V497_04253 [Pseudogymnoascus sp. VKM F-4516 (FW-969)]